MLYVFLLGALVFVIFGQTVGFSFVNYDDNRCVYDNPAVTQGIGHGGFVWAFTHTLNDNWVPLTTLSHMLDCQIYGLKPSGHHLTNVLLHAATVILLFILLRRFGLPVHAAAFSAALFGVHPLRAESVAWVSERKDVLSAFFFVVTLLTYFRYVDLANASNARRSRITWYTATLLLFGLGLLSKPMLVTLPVILLLLDFWPLARMQTDSKRFSFPALRRCSVEKLPFFALSFAAAIANLVAQRNAIANLQSLGIGLRLENALCAPVLYLLKMLVPTGLAAYYPFVPVPMALVIASSIILAAATIVSWKYRMNHPWLVVGWLWYLVMLLPVLGLVQAGSQARADRFTYLPQIGICIIVVYLMIPIATKRQVFATAFAVTIVSALGAAAFMQATYWRDSITLWTRCLASTVDNAFAENNLGAALAAQGRFDEAIAHYQKAIVANPQYVEALNNLGVALVMVHRFPEAAEQYQAALKIKPDSAKTLYNIGNLFDMLGKAPESIDYYQRAVAANPDYAEAQYNLGNELLNQKQPVEAAAHLQRAVALAPDNADAHGNFANALAMQGRIAEAIPHYERALQLNHGDARTWFNYGLSLAAASQLDAAIERFQRAIDAGTSQHNNAVVAAARQQLTECKSKKEATGINDSSRRQQ